jgi:hypothetical protein
MGVTVNHWLVEFDPQMRSKEDLISDWDNRKSTSFGARKVQVRSLCPRPKILES